jgi:DNA-binding response OmpR family regulator
MRRLFRETAQAFKYGAATVPLCSNTVQVWEVGKTMEQEYHLTFGPFRLDVTHRRLWREDQVSALRPRSLAVLRYLVEHPGRMVTKAELRQHVWEKPKPAFARHWMWHTSSMPSRWSCGRR